MIIRITEREKHGAATVQSFVKGRYKVVSGPGLSAAEALLIEALPLLRGPKRLLFLEDRTGVAAIVAGDMHPGAEVMAHSLDLYHCNTVRRNLSRNGAGAVTARCEPYVTETGEFDAVFLPVPKGTMAGELVLDLLQQGHEALRKGGRCFVAVEGDSRWLQKKTGELFGNISARGGNGEPVLLVAKRERDLKKRRDYRSEFTMTRHGGLPVRLVTVPGVFAHRRVDQGAQALAEVAETRPGDAILDMGCGCGCIGISLAVNEPTSRVCLVDAYSRATYVAELGCRLNGLKDWEVLLSDGGVDARDEFTLFVGNPPYFSHHRIPRLFIDTAHRALRPGGRAYVVARQAEWHCRAMAAMFGNAEIVRRRGYEIVKSVKSRKSTGRRGDDTVS